MYGYGSVWEDERSYAQRACAEHTQVDTRAELWTVRALFDHTLASGAMTLYTDVHVYC